MTTRFSWAIATVVGVAALTALASREAVGAAGQIGAAAAQRRAVSRRVDGKPDFSGIWQVMTRRVLSEHQRLLVAVGHPQMLV